MKVTWGPSMWPQPFTQWRICDIRRATAQDLHDQVYIVKESTGNHTQTQWVRYTGKNIQLVQNEELKAEIDRIMKCILVMTFLMG